MSLVRTHKIPGMPWIAGIRYEGTAFFGGSPTTQAIAANTLYAFPIIPVALSRSYGASIAVDRIGIEVTTAASGKVARLGLHAMGANGKPGALLVDAGEVSVASIAGVEAVIDELLQCGVPVFRTLISDGTPTLRAEAGVGVKAGKSAAADGNLRFSWSSSLAYTAGVTTLPDPFPSSPTQQTIVSSIFLRAA